MAKMIKLSELRCERELSQRQMAKVMNVSQSTYNNWENSNTQPSIEQLIALASFFGVSVDYLIGNTDEGVSYGGKFRENEELLSLYNSANPELQRAVKTILQEYVKK